MGELKFAALQTVVLDEADRMLDMGFLDDVSNILQQTPASRSTWLFSATFPKEIRALSQQFQRDSVEVTVEAQHDANIIVQRFYKVEIEEKPEAVVKLLLEQQAESCLIFCNTKIDAKNLTDYLWKRSIPALHLHGDLDQREREETLVQFANGSIASIIAGDSGEATFTSKFFFEVMAGDRSATLHDRCHKATFWGWEHDRLSVEDLSPEAASDPEGVRAEMQTFARCLQQNIDPPVGPRDGTRATAMVLAAFESIRTGKTQELKF